MFVPEVPEGHPDYKRELQVCTRFNQTDELALVLAVPVHTIRQWALLRMRPADHPLGRQYLSGAVAELYAEFRVNAPHRFERARAPFLSTILGQIRNLA